MILLRLTLRDRPVVLQGLWDWDPSRFPQFFHFRDHYLTQAQKTNVWRWIGVNLSFGSDSEICCSYWISLFSKSSSVTLGMSTFGERGKSFRIGFGEEECFWSKCPNFCLAVLQFAPGRNSRMWIPDFHWHRDGLCLLRFAQSLWLWCLSRWTNTCSVVGCPAPSTTSLLPSHCKEKHTELQWCAASVPLGDGTHDKYPGALALGFNCSQ